MKKFISIIITIIVVGLLVFRLMHNKEKNQKEVEIVSQKQGNVSVRVSSVQENFIENQFIANGIFTAQQDLNVASETGGQVVQILVKEGDLVKEGQVLARIKADKHNAGLAQAKALLENAEQEMKRFEKAYKSGGVTRQQLEKIQLQYKNAKASFSMASLNVTDTWVKSKINGIINLKTIEEGSFVGAGTILFNIVNINNLKLKVTIDEAQVSLLKQGQKVQVKPSISADLIEGEISFIAPKSNGALKFPVEISVKNPNHKLKAGMYATAQFSLKSEEKTLLVPRSAFVGSVSQNRIFKVSDQKAELISVKSGRNFGDKVEILSGLSAGEQVIISGQINLDNGTPIKIVQ